MSAETLRRTAALQALELSVSVYCLAVAPRSGRQWISPGRVSLFGAPALHSCRGRAHDEGTPRRPGEVQLLFPVSLQLYCTAAALDNLPVYWLPLDTLHSAATLLKT